jgi:enoyl-CoA hydratase/carnithine racemase
VKVGLTAAAGGLLRLPVRIPRAIAMQLALTGEPIEAERAYEVGLVNALSTPGEALADAVALAGRIAVNAPLSLAASKRIVVESPGWPADEMWARQAEIAGPVRDSRDALEGARAFAEKRAPNWEGR